VLTAEEEKTLVMYAKKCSDHYYGLSINEFKELAYEFAKQRKVKYPSNWDDHKMCGRDWYYGFMRRHKELTLRTPEQTSLNRVKSFSKKNVQLFFRNLDAVLSEHPYQAANIWNMDETGFSTVPTKIGKVISVRGARKVGQISSQERGSVVTMALAVNHRSSCLIGKTCSLYSWKMHLLELVSLTDLGRCSKQNLSNT